MKSSLFLLPLLLALAGRAQFFAAPRHSASVQLGTVGMGAGYQYRLHPKFAVGGSISYLDAAPTLFLKNASQSKQHRVTAYAQFVDVAAFIIWYPGGAEYYGETEGGRLYVKAGLLYRSNPRFLVRSVYQWKQEGKRFNPDDPIRGSILVDITNHAVQPIVNLGYSFWQLNDRMKASIEAGASYHGKSGLKTSEFATPGIDQPNIDRLLRVATNMVVFPQLQISFTYTFDAR